MPKILHTYRYTGTPWEILESVVPDGFTVKTLDEPTYEQLLNEVVDADYLLVSGRLPIDKPVLDAAKKLKMIQRTGVGTEMLDLEEIKKRNIPVYVNAGVNARSVAEHTITLILACLKRLTIVDRQVRNGIWKKQETGTSCHELYGKKVGLVGMGAIGKLVAGYLNAFGAEVYYTDPFSLSSDDEQKLNVHYVAMMENLLPMVDVLSLHCPLTKENEMMLNSDTLPLLRQGAILVNTARGKLIDEDALYDLLSDCHIAFAGLDVHYEEPVKKDDKFMALDNVILTPHIAGLSYESFQMMMQEAVGNIIDFERGDYKKIESHLLKL